MADSESTTHTSHLNVSTFFRYLGYYTFHFNMGNPYLGRKFWGFSDPETPKMVPCRLDPSKALPCTRTRVLSQNLHGRNVCADL